MREILLNDGVGGLQKYLFEVQEGNVSLRRAAKEIYNHLQKEIWAVTLHTPTEEICESKGIDREKLFTPESREKISKLSKEMGLPMGVLGMCGIVARNRTVGYFFSKEEAFKAAERSGTGYNEAGYYEYVIIENFKPSPWCHSWPEDGECVRYFFRYDYGKDVYVKLEEEPEWAQRIINFGLG
jgi:hypothetical protein